MDTIRQSPKSRVACQSSFASTVGCTTQDARLRRSRSSPWKYCGSHNRSDRICSRKASTIRNRSRIASGSLRTRRRSKSRALKSIADGCGRAFPSRVVEFRSKLGKEPKVASLWRMTGPTFAHDLPRAFFDPEHISMMIREIKRQHGESHSRDETAVRTSSTPLVASSAEPYAKGDSRVTDVGSREREWASDTNLLHVRRHSQGGERLRPPRRCGGTATSLP